MHRLFAAAPLLDAAAVADPEIDVARLVLQKRCQERALARARLPLDEDEPSAAVERLVEPLS